MDRDRIVGAPKETKGAATARTGKATAHAKAKIDGTADQAEDKAQHDAGAANDVVRNALAASAAAMTLAGLP